jgi:hypothetical protein
MALCFDAAIFEHDDVIGTAQDGMPMRDGNDGGLRMRGEALP